MIFQVLQDNFDVVIYLIILAAGSFFAIIQFFRTGNLKKLREDLLKVVEEMKFRLPDYQSDKKFDSKTVSQDFTGSNLKKDYVLDERSGELLEKPEKIDLQQVINSCVESSFERVLEKYLPDCVQENTEPIDYTNTMSDLENLSQVLDIAEEYRDKYGLSDDMSVTDIYSYISNLASDLQKGIKKAVEPKQNIENPVSDKQVKE